MRSLSASKKGNQEVTFNGEKFYKQTKAFDKSEDPRFLSGASSVDRSNRKFITSETYYLERCFSRSIINDKIS